jgi:virulence factor Mce-like protein
MRWAERGVSPIKASLIGIVLLVLTTYFVFNKQLPFTKHYTLHAVVQSSNLLAPTSPVRIGGVTVGKVTSTSRYRDTNLALVNMEIDDTSEPIHSDATIAIRPRLFLEGNFYVQLSPGTPSAPHLASGGTIQLAHTAIPVQIDQLLDALPSNTRYWLQQALQGFGTALYTTPTAAENRHLDPAVRGMTAAWAINKTFNTSVPSLRDSAIDSNALTGPGGEQLSKIVSGFGHASAGLARADGQLGAFITDFDRTMQATAAQQVQLRQLVTVLGPTAVNLRTGFGALDAAFPATERWANDFATGLPELPATINSAYPWLAQAGPLFSEAEFRGLLHDIQPATASLAMLTHNQIQFNPVIDQFDRCMTNVFLPMGNLVVNDGPLSSGVKNYQEFWYSMVGQAAEGQNADGNGNFLRIAASGGPDTVQTGSTNFYGNIDSAFAQMAAPPLRTRPSYPNRVPPLKRSVPCYTQPVPNVNGAASFGAPDGSRPHAGSPPLPNDPSRKIG